jgi:hypothetical protein
MSRRVGLFAVALLAMAIRSAGIAETPPLIDRPAPEAGPTEVSVGIWVVDLTKIDSAQQDFTADVAVVLRWKDSRLVHAGSGVAHYPLDQIWNPRVGVANETNSVVHKLPDVVEVEPDGTVLYRQRYVGPFNQALRLRSFPFDKQTFAIHLVAVRYTPMDVSFVPDEKWIEQGLKRAAGISPSVTLPDWMITNWETNTQDYSLTPGLNYSGYAFQLTAVRNAQHYVWKVILPLVLIVFMSWAVFWISPNEANSQISIAVTSMLTLIAYRFAIDSQLPRLPYITRLDAFIVMSTVLVFLSFIEVLITTIFNDRGKATLAGRIDRYARIIFPLVFVVASFAIFGLSRD